MKETTETTTIEFDVVSRETGEMQTVVGTTVSENKYYSIRDITTRINQMDYTQAVTEICRTPQQGKLFAKLMDSVNCDNRMIILNQRELAKQQGVSIDILKRVLSKLAKSNLAVKIQTGEYVINPYIYIGRRTRSNEAREQLQAEWPSIVARYS